MVFQELKAREARWGILGTEGRMERQVSGGEEGAVIISYDLIIYLYNICSNVLVTYQVLLTIGRSEPLQLLLKRNEK